jgi:branched-chain amino acid transport system substrate-binding protein
MLLKRFVQLTGTVLVLAAACSSAFAQKKYDVGATDTEIKLGNIMPYSGPASAYGAIGKTEEAYFRKVNDDGGINGRKITFISYDDGYSPPKAVEQARKLVESDEVLAIVSPMGTPSNSAIQKYLNLKKIPHLFPASNASKWADPVNFPWTMGPIGMGYLSEGRVFATYLLKEKPGEKIAVLYQNDDFGKELLRGLKAGLGDKASLIVAELGYEVSDPTIESQIVTLKHSGATVLMSFATPKFVSQSIKRVAQIGWTPLHFVPSVASSIGTVMIPAGFENSQGVVSGTIIKDTADPQWKDDAGMKAYNEFLDRYLPDANKSDALLEYGYTVAQAIVQVLKQCGDDLTRANVMKQAASLRDVSSDVLVPGILINTSATNFAPIQQLQLMRFKGERWETFGNILEASPR